MKHSSKDKITIRDIAEICGVSIQTVSRVINKRPDVSKATREKIEAVIDEKGFAPNAVARSLVSRHSRTLGVIIGGLRYISVAYNLNGINEACEEAGYSLIIKELIQIDSTDIGPIIQTMVENQVEGIIYTAPWINNNTRIMMDNLPPFCPPIVFKSEPYEGHATIAVDNYGGAQKAIEHLISLGCRHIGQITGPMNWLDSIERQKAVSDTLQAHGLEFTENSWVEGDWTGASGHRLLPMLLRRYPKMDGIFVANDEMAMGVIRYANANHIRIPEDIALVGFDDQNESAFFTPSITTVSHPLRELGKMSVKMILSMINGEADASQAQILNTELIVRESSAGKI